MKNYSPVPPSTAATNALNAVQATFSAACSARLASDTAPAIPAMPRDLKPPFLEGLTPLELKSVLAAAQLRRFPANSVITNQDHPAKDFFLLLTGRARYFFMTEKGQKVILLWIPPGEIFGGAAFLSYPSRYLVSTETVNNSSVLVWDRTALRSLAVVLPRLIDNALGLTFHYLAAYRAAHMSLICNTASERLAHVLVSLASGIGHKVTGGVELKIRNEELANEANVTLFTASRLLSQWQRRGMLQKSRGKFLVRSPELLLRHAA